MQEPRPGLAELSWRARAALAAWAFIGTGLHAGSFALLPSAERLLPLAAGIGISAALSWFIVGLAVLAMLRRQPERSARLAMWFDTCLIAMAVGECLLVAAGGLNAIAAAGGLANEPEFMLRLHLIILLVTDLVMAAVFARRARRAGESLATAAALWIIVLNGSFALLLWALAGPLGYGD